MNIQANDDDVDISPNFDSKIGQNKYPTQKHSNRMSHAISKIGKDMLQDSIMSKGDSKNSSFKIPLKKDNVNQ